jgi:hypothetical protein
LHTEQIGRKSSGFFAKVAAASQGRLALRSLQLRTKFIVVSAFALAFV